MGSEVKERSPGNGPGERYTLGDGPVGSKEVKVPRDGPGEENTLDDSPVGLKEKGTVGDAFQGGKHCVASRHAAGECFFWR